MTKPVGKNAQLAKTCDECGERILTAYNATIDDHSHECWLNKSLADIERDKLKRLDVTPELDTLLESAHGLPFEEYRIKIPNGRMMALYAPNWLYEGVNMYYSMQIDGLSMGDFLTSLKP